MCLVIISHYLLQPVILFLFLDTLYAEIPVYKQVNITCCKGSDVNISLYDDIKGESVKEIAWSKGTDLYLSFWNGSTFSGIPDSYKNKIRPFKNGSLILKSCQMSDVSVYRIELLTEHKKTKYRIKRLAKANLSVVDWKAPAGKIYQAEKGTKYKNCEEFRCFEGLTFLGEPPVDFEWENEGILIKGSIKHNFGYMLVCPRNRTGDFTCRLTGVALNCLPPHSDLKKTMVFHISSLLEDIKSLSFLIIMLIGVITLLSLGIFVFMRQNRNKSDDKQKLTGNR